MQIKHHTKLLCKKCRDTDCTSALQVLISICLDQSEAVCSSAFVAFSCDSVRSSWLATIDQDHFSFLAQCPRQSLYPIQIVSWNHPQSLFYRREFLVFTGLLCLYDLAQLIVSSSLDHTHRFQDLQHQSLCRPSSQLGHQFFQVILSFPPRWFQTSLTFWFHCIGAQTRSPGSSTCWYPLHA